MIKYLVAFSLLMLYMACSDSADSNNDNNNEELTQTVMMLPKTQTVLLTADQKSCVAKNNVFAFRLFQKAWQEQLETGKSLLLSPLSVSYIMGMLGDGAQGKTAEEIFQTMGFDINSRAMFDELNYKLMQELPQVDQSVTLAIANAIVANKDVELEPGYKQTVINTYQAEVTSLDFALASSVDYINSWCKNKTNGMIPELLQPSELNAASAMILMNATYFKATWAKKFDKSYTHNEIFTVGTDERTVPMMHQKAEIQYVSTGLCSMINLPYGGGDKWSMTVILPADGKNVNDVIHSLTGETYQQLLAGLRTYDVDIKIPRFTTASDMELNNTIAALGAPSIFSPDEADFSPMTINRKKGALQSLYVGRLKQKSMAEVNEEGTAMSAVTVAMMSSANANPSASFHCNRPFIYVVREASSGIILFTGCYCGD